jgi:hypothetical protein
VSSEAASSDPSSLREAWGRETVVDCARSFQLPVETSRRLWKFRKEVETRARTSLCVIFKVPGTASLEVAGSVMHDASHMAGD